MKRDKPKTKNDTSGIHLWLLLRKASRSFESHAVRHISTLGLGLSDFAVLEALLHKGSLSVQEIAAKVLLTSGSMTAALDRLERRGLAEREENATDRRIRNVRLTAAGKSLVSKAFEEHEQVMERAASGITKSEREVLINLLRKAGRSAEADLKQSQREE